MKGLVAIMGKHALILLNKIEESYKYFICKCSLVWETRNKNEEENGSYHCREPISSYCEE